MFSILSILPQSCLTERIAMPSSAVSHQYDLTATNAVWIALATLHSDNPEEEGFSPSEIEDRVAALNLFQKDPSTITTHIKQHLAAKKPSNAKPRRMITELSGGRRRLFVEGDEYHSSRINSPSHPSPDDLPTEFRPLLYWYENWSRQVRDRRASPKDRDPLEALAGTWTFGDADEYVREMREGWEGR
jgi:hypothetical protein